MPESREVRCYEYVSLPYEQVGDLLRSDAKMIFSRATASTADRVRELIATLRLNVGVLEVGVDVRLQLTLMADELSATSEPRTRLDFTWEAAQGAGFFPTMEATLSAYPLSPGETQLDLHGHYRPPLGSVGTALDVAVGHRIAEATLLRLLRDLRTEITQSIKSRGEDRSSASNRSRR